MITPDLSSKYLPQPKPHKVEKVKVTKIGVGDKVNEWTEARKEIKQQFQVWKIFKCELNYKGCWKDNALTFAHAEKRRKLTKEDLYKVALLCVPCHDQIEYLPAGEMKRIVEGIIRVRKIKK